MTETERLVGAIWNDLLQPDSDLGLQADFFESGGDSLTMTMLLFRVKEELGVELSPAALMYAPTLGQFCQVVEANRDSLDESEEAESEEFGSNLAEPL